MEGAQYIWLDTSENWQTYKAKPLDSIPRPQELLSTFDKGD